MSACLQAESAVLDGAIVFLGSDGRPEFYNLMRRRTPQHFYAFDILWLDGKDLRGLPLLERNRYCAASSPYSPRRCSMSSTSIIEVLICSERSAKWI
jgi:ATP-dependent DNA ligase